MKTTVLFLTLILSSLSYAQILEQLMTPVEPLHDELMSMEFHSQGVGKGYDIGEGVLVRGMSDQEFGVIGFSFAGPGAKGGERTFVFQFPERARQAMVLRITDDTKSSDGNSARLLETSLYFFPRHVVPSLEVIGGVMEMTLPTGEKVQLNPKTKAITGGALIETAPLDLNPDKVKRKFAPLSYQGEGVMIRVDRRAGTPETTYKQIFNVNEDIENATITFKGKTCKVPKELLWDQNENREYFFLHATDEEFYSKILQGRCGWSERP